MVKRKNFLPTLLIALFFWINIVFIVLYIPPSPLAICYLLSAIFIALLLTLSLVLGNSRSGFLISLGITLFLFLRLTKMVNNLNLILLAGILFSLELYLKKR
ncbi:MAG: hypothetical protein V1858_00620 [Candidatus Gottesmanbacteria bacterium]